MTRSVFQAEAERGLALIDVFFDEVFELVEEWAPQVQRDLEKYLEKGALTDAQLAALVEERSLTILKETQHHIYGAGFCASDSIVAHGNPLAWWQGPNHEPLASSTFGVGPGSVDLRRLEWYRVPETTGKRTIAGPFVDYLCSNEVTLTASSPIFINDKFAGVLCVDVLVSAFEDQFLPKLQSENHVTVMNAHRRLVVSTDIASITGDRVAQDRLENPESGHASSTRHPFIVLSELSL